MRKKAFAFLSVCLLLFGFGFSTLAEEADSAPVEANESLYGSYEDDWFDNGYEGIENEPDLGDDSESVPLLTQWYRRMSIVPVVLGVLVSAAAVFVLYKNSRSEPPEAVPYELRAETHLAAQNDWLADVKHTTRKLSSTISSEERREKREK